MIFSLCRGLSGWTGGAFQPSSRWIQDGKLHMGTLRGLEWKTLCLWSSISMLLGINLHAIGHQTQCYSNAQSDTLISICVSITFDDFGKVVAKPCQKKGFKIRLSRIYLLIMSHAKHLDTLKAGSIN